MADIVAKRKAKKEAENIVNNLETESKNAEQLKKQLEEVEKSKGQQSYEDNQSGIDNLKDELSKKVSQEEYCQIIVNTIEKNMAKYDVKSNELTPEVRKELERLKSGEIKDKNQINEIEKKVAKNVGEKGSKKKLNLILIESMEALNSGKKDKIKKAKDKLNNFLFTTDIYEKALLSQKENDIKQALKKLENYSAQKQTNSDKFP
ncbi:388_t:CDS:1 [Paraglomus brasilianum]|uniref:388_t:CDS:1 n=1 Tax=Paraglomus brasilianum TaxID=144538 RepID=A0A9N9B4W3_9GLOM|nr:388_t:CDS:1 [Paraglomus brasilianum]